MATKQKGMTCAVYVEAKKTNRILLCHATSTKYWTTPKGMYEKNLDNSYADAAIRELREETSIVAKNEDLILIGTYSYSAIKDITLYYYQVHEEIPVESLKCTSTFKSHYKNKDLPEVDSYIWINFRELKKFTNPRQLDVLTSKAFQDSLAEIKIGLV